MKLFSYDEQICRKVYKEKGRVGIIHMFKAVFLHSYKRRRRHGIGRLKSVKESGLDFIYHYCAWKAYLYHR